MRLLLILVLTFSFACLSAHAEPVLDTAAKRNVSPPKPNRRKRDNKVIFDTITHLAKIGGANLTLFEIQKTIPLQVTDINKTDSYTEVKGTALPTWEHANIVISQLIPSVRLVVNPLFASVEKSEVKARFGQGSTEMNGGHYPGDFLKYTTDDYELFFVFDDNGHKRFNSVSISWNLLMLQKQRNEKIAPFGPMPE